MATSTLQFWSRWPPPRCLHVIMSMALPLMSLRHWLPSADRNKSLPLALCLWVPRSLGPWVPKQQQERLFPPFSHKPLSPCTGWRCPVRCLSPARWVGR